MLETFFKGISSNCTIVKSSQVISRMNSETEVQNFGFVKSSRVISRMNSETEAQNFLFIFGVQRKETFLRE
jgi:hypothetical protein